MDYEEMGHKLKVERVKLNYKQEYLAEKIGVQQKYISKIEHGGAKPEFAKIYELANLLGVSLDYLAGREGTMNDDYLTKHHINQIAVVVQQRKNTLVRGDRILYQIFKRQSYEGVNDRENSAVCFNVRNN